MELLLQGADLDSSAEMVDELMNEEERSTFQARFQALPPSDCGPGINPFAVAIEESESERGQLLLMGGRDESGTPSSAVYKVRDRGVYAIIVTKFYGV